MKCLNLALVVAIISGCASNKQAILPYPTNDEYQLIVEKYRKKLDLQWVKKFADDPNFGKDFDNCRTESDIAQWIEKHFYIEINYCLDQLKNDWTDLLHTKSVRFVEDRYLVDQELKYLEEKFRNDILRVYVLRHQYYVKKGLIKPR